MLFGGSPLNGLILKDVPEITPRNGDDDTSLASEKKDRIRVKNRRKMYLDSHPSYFESPDLEIVGMKLTPAPTFNGV